MALTKQRYTFDDLLALQDDGHSYELLDGELFLVTSPTLDHSDVVGELYFWLGRAQRAGHGKAYTAPTSVLLDASIRRENAPEPDAFFVRAENQRILTGRYVEGLPDLLIEVLSDRTRAHDLPGGRKWNTYERFGVPNYWIVDPETRVVAQYIWRNGRYQEPVMQRHGDILLSSLCMGIVLPVADLFQGVRQPARPLRGLGPFRLVGQS